MGAIESCNT